MILVDYVTLQDIHGDTYKAVILFTHFDYHFGKNYIVYLVENDLLASSYEEKDGHFIIDNNLTSAEYDMIDQVIESKMEKDNE